MSVKNKRGQTPLQVAMGGGGRNRAGADVAPAGPDTHQQTVELLRKLGAE